MSVKMKMKLTKEQIEEELRKSQEIQKELQQVQTNKIQGLLADDFKDTDEFEYNDIKEILCEHIKKQVNASNTMQLLQEETLEDGSVVITVQV